MEQSGKKNNKTTLSGGIKIGIIIIVVFLILVGAKEDSPVNRFIKDTLSQIGITKQKKVFLLTNTQKEFSITSGSLKGLNIRFSEGSNFGNAKLLINEVSHYPLKGASMNSLGPAVDFKFESGGITEPATITLPIDGDLLNIPVVGYFNEQTQSWKFIAIDSYNRANKTVTFRANHFSTYQPLEIDIGGVPNILTAIDGTFKNVRPLLNKSDLSDEERESTITQLTKIKEDAFIAINAMKGDYQGCKDRSTCQSKYEKYEDFISAFTNETANTITSEVMVDCVLKGVTNATTEAAFQIFSLALFGWDVAVYGDCIICFIPNSVVWPKFWGSYLNYTLAKQQLEKLQSSSSVFEGSRGVQMDAFRQVLGIISNDMVTISGGSFDMGCSDIANGECFPEEKPNHLVTVSSFKISKHEITWAQFNAITSPVWGMDDRFSRFNGMNITCLDCPAEVSWYEAKSFVELLGGDFRLPTEAEWEFAARGGSSARLKYSGDNSSTGVGWTKENSGGSSHPVGSKSPNSSGIFDMSGNVWEWCEDWYDESYYRTAPTNNPKGSSNGKEKILRGGGWKHQTRYARISNRGWDDPNKFISYGFRVIESSEKISSTSSSLGLQTGNIQANHKSSNGSCIDADGNVYETAQIGNQVWTAENLHTTKYANGNPIREVGENNKWGNLTAGAFSNYENEKQNVLYGKLYNWYATIDSRNICPNGWHVPSDQEWETLINHSNEDPNKALKFFLGGYRSYSEGTFNDIGSNGVWWSSTTNSNNMAWFRNKGLDNNWGRGPNYKTSGFSVRCLKD